MFSVFLGSLDNGKSIGTNRLIQEFAELVMSPMDIISKYEFLHKIEIVKKETLEKDEYDINDEYKEIYRKIKEEPININDIVKNCNMNLKDVMSSLTMLEIEGKIKKVSGNRYVRNNL